MMSSQVPTTSSVSSPSIVSIMASSSVERVRFQAYTSCPPWCAALANDPPMRPSPTTPTRPGTKVRFSPLAMRYSLSRSAVTASRMSAMRFMASANWAGVRAWAPSDQASCGQLWTSISRPSAPAAVAA